MQSCLSIIIEIIKKSYAHTEVWQRTNQRGLIFCYTRKLLEIRSNNHVFLTKKEQLTDYSILDQILFCAYIKGKSIPKNETK